MKRKKRRIYKKKPRIIIWSLKDIMKMERKKIFLPKINRNKYQLLAKKIILVLMQNLTSFLMRVAQLIVTVVLDKLTTILLMCKFLMNLSNQYLMKKVDKMMWKVIQIKIRSNRKIVVNNNRTKWRMLIRMLRVRRQLMS